jgi:hypothetical protein
MIEPQDLKFIEDNIIHLEQVRLGFIQGMDDRKKQQFHAIHQKYVGLMTLTVWCSSCVIDMMKRIDRWYQNELATVKTDDFVFPDDLDKIVPEVAEEQPKKRGRKPKQ